MPQPVRLSAADYERLLRLAADVRIAELEAAVLAERAKAKVVAAKAAHVAHLAVLARRYRHFHASGVHYRPDDGTCTLVPVPGPQGP